MSFMMLIDLVNALQVMEQFFGLVNTFLQNNRDTWKRRLGVRTYKVPTFKILFNFDGHFDFSIIEK
jgi:hypothetical protein